MNTWRAWLDSLDTPGGHIVLLVFVLVLLMLATVWKIQGIDKFMGEAFGALLYSLRGTISNGAEKKKETT